MTVNTKELYKTIPPPFGHDVRPLFGFEPNYINLNIGGCLQFLSIR